MCPPHVTCKALDINPRQHLKRLSRLTVKDRCKKISACATNVDRHVGLLSDRAFLEAGREADRQLAVLLKINIVPLRSLLTCCNHAAQLPDRAYGPQQTIPMMSESLVEWRQ